MVQGDFRASDCRRSDGRRSQQVSMSEVSASEISLSEISFSLDETWAYMRRGQPEEVGVAYSSPGPTITLTLAPNPGPSPDPGPNLNSSPEPIPTAFTKVEAGELRRAMELSLLDCAVSLRSAVHGEDAQLAALHDAASAARTLGVPEGTSAAQLR